jgi:N-acetylgalactosamine kinase
MSVRVSARSPGRVNLIGEHIDYSGYSVLPMAIDRCATVDAEAHAGAVLTLTIAHRDSERYATLSSSGPVSIDTTRHSWANYVLCGVKGIENELARRGLSWPDQVKVVRVVVDGDVPQGAGLSSSSALVCATVQALAKVVSLELDGLEIAQLAIDSERYCGTLSGGMDQAISTLAQEGFARRIDFHPLRATNVKLPEGVSFVIGDSHVVSEKAVTADRRYNLRVVEVRLATAVLARALGVSDSLAVPNLKALQEALGAPLASMPDLVAAHLPEPEYTYEAVAGLLALPGGAKEALERFGISPTTGKPATTATSFRLRDRALHVYREAARVFEFERTCAASEDPASAPTLGRLMNESHASCRDLFECSCAELDELTDRARQLGALGSRLTGAGWGGCFVSLVRDEDVDRFLAEMAKVVKVDQGACLFATRPARGGSAARADNPE